VRVVTDINRHLAFTTENLHDVFRILHEELVFGVACPSVTSPLSNVPDIQTSEDQRGANQRPVKEDQSVNDNQHFGSKSPIEPTNIQIPDLIDAVERHHPTDES